MGDDSSVMSKIHDSIHNTFVITHNAIESIHNNETITHNVDGVMIHADDFTHNCDKITHNTDDVMGKNVSVMSKINDFTYNADDVMDEIRVIFEFLLKIAILIVTRHIPKRCMCGVGLKTSGFIRVI